MKHNLTECPYLKTQTNECTYKNGNKHNKKLPKCRFKQYIKCPLYLQSKLNGGKKHGETERRSPKL